ncbi:MAG: ABC transporter substrate-binding protein [Opitutales bacterium]
MNVIRRMLALGWLGLATGLAASEVAYPLSISDGRAREVVIPARPERVISLAPSCTEIVFALDAGGQLAGRTRFCDYPEAVKQVPSIGGIVDYNRERMATLKPDLILVSDLTQPTSLPALMELGAPVVYLNHPGLDGITKDIALAGKILDQTEATERELSRIQNIREEVAARLQKASPAKRPKVLLTFGLLTTYAPGPNTYPGHLIREAGGANVAAGGTDWQQLPLESVLIANPDVLLVSLDPEAPEARDRAALLAQYRRHEVWRHLASVKAGRVHAVDANLLNRPGPRAVSLLPVIADLLHPVRE